MVNNAYTQVSRACKGYSRMPNVQTTENANVETLIANAFGTRCRTYRYTRFLLYSGKGRKKRGKKQRERKRQRYARSNYTINVLDGPSGDVKIRKVYVVWNLRSLRLLCRRTILYVLIGYLSIINWIVYQFLRLLVKKRGGNLLMGVAWRDRVVVKSNS